MTPRTYFGRKFIFILSEAYFADGICRILNGNHMRISCSKTHFSVRECAPTVMPTTNPLHNPTREPVVAPTFYPS